MYVICTALRGPGPGGQGVESGGMASVQIRVKSTELRGKRGRVCPMQCESHVLKTGFGVT